MQGFLPSVCYEQCLFLPSDQACYSVHISLPKRIRGIAQYLAQHLSPIFLHNVYIYWVINCANAHCSLDTMGGILVRVSRGSIREVRRDTTFIKFERPPNAACVVIQGPSLYRPSPTAYAIQTTV